MDLNNWTRRFDAARRTAAASRPASLSETQGAWAARYDAAARKGR